MFSALVPAATSILSPAISTALAYVSENFLTGLAITFAAKMGMASASDCESPFVSFASSFNSSCLENGGPLGFSVTGMRTASQVPPASLRFSGDINSDGSGDLGIDNFANTYAVFGRSGNTGFNIDVNALNGSNGFSINALTGFPGGTSTPIKVGDLNRDGIDDFAVVNEATANADIVFGSKTGFPKTIDLSTLNGTNGVHISWPPNTGHNPSIAPAGDFNGDGFDDLLLAFSEAPDFSGTLNKAGAVFVLFSSEQPFNASVDLTGIVF
jgi:hypothetical protein